MSQEGVALKACLRAAEARHGNTCTGTLCPAPHLDVLSVNLQRLVGLVARAAVVLLLQRHLRQVQVAG